jgi:hypothetical protein
VGAVPVRLLWVLYRCVYCGCCTGASTVGAVPVRLLWVLYRLQKGEKVKQSFGKPWLADIALSAHVQIWLGNEAGSEPSLTLLSTH